MPLTPIQFDIGVAKTQSPYAAGKTTGYTEQHIVRGRWTNANNVQFIAGFPEKIAGWINQTSTAAGIYGVPRAARAWRGVDGLARMCIGTSQGVFVWNDNTLTDITPFSLINFVDTGLTVSTTISQNTVQISNFTDTNFLAPQVNDWVIITLASSIGGIKLSNATVQVSGVGSGYFIVTTTQTATSTSSTTMNVNAYFPRLQVSNAISTTAGSSIFKVTVPLGLGVSTAINFSKIYISNASSVGGITTDGEFTVVSSTSSGGYAVVSVQGQNAATSTATGGGTAYLQLTNTPTTTTTPLTPPVPGWTLFPYGGLMSIGQSGGTIYLYDPIAGGVAYPLQNAPTQIQAHFVTPERFIVALGTASSPLQLAWCDQQDPTDWTSLSTNTANSGRNLIGGSRFVTGIPVSDGISLILTDRCAFMMQYTGDNEVYATPLKADNAGCLSTWGVTVTGETAYWMNDSDFWMFNGTVSNLPSDDIREYVFDNIDPNNYGKMIAGTNRANNQVMFFWTSLSSSNAENDTYTIFQTESSSFCQPDVGNTTLNPTPWSRSAWADSDLFANPYGLNSSGVLYKHEYGYDADGTALVATLQTSFMELSNGDANMNISGLIADMQSLTGQVSVNWSTQYYPGDSATLDVTGSAIIQSGSTYTGLIDNIREDGKLLAIQFVCGTSGGTTGYFFRLGVPRVMIQPQSARL